MVEILLMFGDRAPAARPIKNTFAADGIDIPVDVCICGVVLWFAPLIGPGVGVLDSELVGSVLLLLNRYGL